MSRKILVASYTSDIITLSWDTTASPPSLSVVCTLEVGHNPCWITPHTTDRSLVFTVNEQTDGKVKALRYDLNTGKGSVVGETSSGGADPCHIVMSGNELMVANVSRLVIEQPTNLKAFVLSTPVATSLFFLPRLVFRICYPHRIELYRSLARGPSFPARRPRIRTRSSYIPFEKKCSYLISDLTRYGGCQELGVCGKSVTTSTYRLVEALGIQSSSVTIPFELLGQLHLPGSRRDTIHSP